MKNKRYIFLLCGFSGGISGGDEHALQLISYLASAGNSVSVILPRRAYESHIPDSIIRIALPSLPFESHFWVKKPLLFFIYLWRILFAWLALWRLRLSENDVVISASHLFHDTWPLWSQRRKASEFVYAYHLIQFCINRTGWSTRVSTALERWSLAVVAAREMNVVTSSAEVRRQLEMVLNVPASTIELTRNGVDTKLIQATPRQAKSLDIVFCGRMVTHKGVPDLLKALQILDDPKISVALIGRGPLLEEIQVLIAEYGLSNVATYSNADNQEKFRIMKSAKVFVLPSYEEGWGIVIGEALACGAKVIAYAINEIQSIWNDGIIWVPIGRVDLLAKAISTALSEDYDATTSPDYWIDSLNWQNILEIEFDFIQQRSRHSRQAV